MTNIEITLTNLLAFTRSSEHWTLFFQKSHLEKAIFTSNCKQMFGVCVCMGGAREQVLQETACLLILWFLPIISTLGHLGNYYGATIYSLNLKPSPNHCATSTLEVITLGLICYQVGNSSHYSLQPPEPISALGAPTCCGKFLLLLSSPIQLLSLHLGICSP